MKLTTKHLLIAVMALVLGAIPALALAQSPFRADDNSSCAQYPETCPTTTDTTPTGTTTTTGGGVSVTVTTPVGTVAGTVTVASKPTTTTTKPTKTNNGNGDDNNGNNGNNGNGKNDKGGNAPDTGAGANGPGAGGSGGNANGTGSSAGNGSACTWRPYAWIAFGPARQDAFSAAAAVTGTPMYAAQITEPLDPAAIKQATAGTQWAGAETDLAKLKAFSKALGKSVVDGGDLAQKALPLLATGVTAEDLHPAAGFVLTENEPDLPQNQDRVRDAFTKYFIKGMRSVKIPTAKRGKKVPVPIVGVELKPLKDTTVPFFKKHKVASVDDVETKTGQRDLSRALSGWRGHFGDKPPSVGNITRTAAPLLCRPTADYEPGDLIRRSQSGLPGGAASTGMLLLLGLLSAGALLAVVERRTRRLRHRER